MPDYYLISKRSNSVEISIKTSTSGEVSHLVIDGTGLKVFREGEGKVRQHGANKKRVWSKLNIPTDSVTHEIICANLSLSIAIDSNLLPTLRKQSHRKIREVSADGAYDVGNCLDCLLNKNKIPLVLTRASEQYWSNRYHERNYAVTSNRLRGNNDSCEKKVDYSRRQCLK